MHFRFLKENNFIKLIVAFKFIIYKSFYETKGSGYDSNVH